MGKLAPNTLKNPITPQPGYVLVAPYEEKIKGGFEVADTLKDKETAGLVLAVGGIATNQYGNKVETDVKEGQVIIFEAYTAKQYTHHGKMYRLVKFDGISGVIDEQ